LTNSYVSALRGSFMLMAAVLIGLKIMRMSYVPLIIVSLEAVELLRFSSILKKKSYANLEWVISHLIILHVSLFIIFESESIRYMIAVSFVI
jgi:hypothetical protein